MTANDSDAAGAAPSRRRVVRVCPRRRVLRRPATVLLPDGIVLDARTTELGADGLSLLAAQPVCMGCKCMVKFGVPLDGKLATVTASVKVASCALSGVDGFKVGLVFAGLDAPSARIVGAFAK